MTLLRKNPTVARAQLHTFTLRIRQTQSKHTKEVQIVSLQDAQSQATSELGCKKPSEQMYMGDNMTDSRDATNNLHAKKEDKRRKRHRRDTCTSWHRHECAQRESPGYSTFMPPGVR